MSRTKLLKELGEVIDKSTAREWLDELPWTPGPRKGIALASFVERQSEGPDDVKHRMQEVVNLINRPGLSAPGTDVQCGLPSAKREPFAVMRQSCLKNQKVGPLLPPQHRGV